MLPAGAPGMKRPVKGLKGIVGRIIAKRQGIPYSHTGIALGNGFVLESTMLYTKISPEEHWEGTDWWELYHPLGAERQRQLRSLAYFIRDRIKYSWWDHLCMFLFKGVPGKRGHGLVCTYLVAEVMMTLLNIDMTTIKQPWNMDLREELSFLNSSGYFRRMK